MTLHEWIKKEIEKAQHGEGDCNIIALAEEVEAWREGCAGITTHEINERWKATNEELGIDD